MAWTEKVGNGYRGRFHDHTGKDQTAQDPETGRKVQRSKKKAFQLACDAEAEVRRGTYVDPKAGAITFSTYFETKWLPNKVAEKNTIANYRTIYNAGLKAEFGDRPLNRIMHSDVQGWVSRMHQDGVGPRTIQARFRGLQTILAAKKGVCAIADGLIARNPCERVELPFVPEREINVFTQDQVDQLVEVIGWWWFPLVVLDGEIAVRWGELMGLQVDDFTLGFKSVKIRRTILELTKAETGNGTVFLTKEYPKGRRRRHIAISKDVGKMVEAMIAARGLGPGDRLFSMPDKTGPDWQPDQPETWVPLRTDVWPHGEPVGRSHWRKYVWLPALQRAGVPQLRTHDLRASCLSWMLHGGADIPTVMDVAGHVDWETTRKYRAPMEEATKRSLDALKKSRKRMAAQQDVAPVLRPKFGPGSKV